MSKDQEKVVMNEFTVDGLLRVSDGTYFKHPDIKMYPKSMPSSKAEFAKAMIERFALIAGKHDGEDSTGRRQGRNMTPDEIVSHCCDVSAKSFDEFKKRGWLIEMPPIEMLS